MLISTCAALAALFSALSIDRGSHADRTATALISNDIVGLGLIAATLALIFWAASGPTPLLKKIFAWVPALLLCYFIPAIYNTAGVIDGHNTSLYNPVARDVLLPAAGPADPVDRPEGHPSSARNC
jgi:hypothetical protein